ncbi:MAG: OmpH family outer membrane protein [bacterium]
MTHFKTLAALVAILMLAAPAWSQNSGILKIGVVDIPRLLQESPQFQEARSKLEDEFVPREREIIAKQAALEEKAKKLEQDMPVMGESEREAAQRDLRNDERDLVRAQSQYREDGQEREAEIMRAMQQEILEQIYAYGQEQQYDIILQAGPSGAIFASTKVDITLALIQRLQSTGNNSGN